MRMIVCVSSPRVLSKHEKQRLIQFLIGLNEIFTTIISNLLMLNPSPTLNYVYYVLI